MQNIFISLVCVENNKSKENDRAMDNIATAGKFAPSQSTANRPQPTDNCDNLSFVDDNCSETSNSSPAKGIQSYDRSICEFFSH